MNNGYFKYYRPQILVSLLVVLAILLYFARSFWGLSVSIVSIITGLLFCIDKWLWKTPLFSWMFWTDDFSGRYEGQLEYEYRDEKCKTQKGVLRHVKVVHQSGSKITIFSFTIEPDGTQSSFSESQGLYVKNITGDGHYEIIYSYLNQGSRKRNFPPHYGTEIVKVIGTKEDRILSGRYFTEREPFSTKGKFLDLKWVSASERHDF